MPRPKDYENVGKTITLVENAILDLECYYRQHPNYDITEFRGGLKIAISVLMSEMYNLQKKENMDMEDRVKMAEALGEDFTKLVKTYTDINCKDLYK